MDYRNELGNWEEIILEPSGDTLPVGSITQFGGSAEPTNWLFCNGQAVSRTDYKELFEAIGTTYGDGDGSTTFNVPNFSSRSPMGVGTGTDGTNSETTTLGQEKGEYKHKLTENEIPPLTTYAPSQTSGGNMAYLTNWSGYNGSGLGTTPITKTKTTNAKAHNTVHPVLGVNYIIKAKQSVGLVGNVVSDINATGDNDVAPTKVIKDYVDKANTYSTDEIVVGTYLGKPLYRKVIDFGTLPNNSAKAIPTGLDHKKINLIALYGIAKDSNGTQFTINQSRINSLGSQIGTYLNNINELVIEVGTDRSSFSAFVTLEYTKQ